MITQETKEILENIYGTPYGRALDDYLAHAIETLNDVKTCKSWEETLGRAHAIQVIENLFSLMKLKKVEAKTKNVYT